MLLFNTYSYGDDNVPIIEVIGATGRIGSLFLRHPNAKAIPRSDENNVHNSNVPGSTYSKGPVIVATPSKVWSTLHEMSLRKRDMVYIGNGLIEDYMVDTTIAIPHFGILAVGADPITCSSLSPPTFVYGRYASLLGDYLAGHGITTEIVHDFNVMRYYAARKLLWASCMWLLCHGINSAPKTVKEVHEQHSDILVDLVQELLPALSSLCSSPASSRVKFSCHDIEVSSSIKESFNEIIQYMENYSMSMPMAVPSKELAMLEFEDRNGAFLALSSDDHPQKLHKELVERFVSSSSR